MPHGWGGGDEVVVSWLYVKLIVEATLELIAPAVTSRT
jgi:hypothetical protein